MPLATEEWKGVHGMVERYFCCWGGGGGVGWGGGGFVLGGGGVSPLTTKN